jgi:hypothetical protein
MSFHTTPLRYTDTNELTEASAAAAPSKCCYENCESDVAFAFTVANEGSEFQKPSTLWGLECMAYSHKQWYVPATGHHQAMGQQLFREWLAKAK